MNNRLVIPLLVAGAVAFACGPRPSTEASTPPASTVGVTRAPTPKRARRQSDARLEPTVVVSRTAGGSVRVALHAVNTGDKGLELAFANRQTHDVAVLDASCREVWRWSEGRLFTQTIRRKAVGGHDTLSYNETWRPEGAHGRYVAVATLRSTNHPVERRAEFVLP